jgi:uncharacterized membrane protein YphA (DoxX/SURF4 family)
METTRTVGLWVLQIAVGGLLLFAGWGKLAGSPMHVELFSAIGLGQWLRYATGALEVGGALALFVPSLAVIGALTLAAVMAGAVFTHLFIVGGSPIVPLLLFVGATTIAWLRRERILSLARA